MTREEAIEVIEQDIPCEHDRDLIEALDMAISALKPTCKIDESNFSMEQYRADLQSAYDCGKAEADEWIPVSERLPDNNVRVLCSAISTSISGGYTRFVGCCDNGFWFVQTDAETLSYPRQYEVTAWQPLPESYKAEREE